MENAQPNVVWIMADDLGWGDLGCYGQQITKTPRLDRMAREGTRFTDCYAGAHMCAPSRATFHTGKHEGHSSVREIWFRNGFNNRAHLRPHEVTVAQTLREAGYATGIFGKRHAIDVGMSRHFGFDTFYHAETGHPVLGAHYPTAIETESGSFDIPFNADIGNSLSKVRNSVDREIVFDYIDKYRDWEDGTYMDDICTDAACSFIREKQDKPFFLYLSFHAPHTLYVSPDIGDYMHKDWDPLSIGYVPMIERLDSHVGKVLDALGAAGLDENTIIFFTSDNGGVCRDGRGGDEREGWVSFRNRLRVNRDLRKGKHYHFEGGIRVPMIVRWPSKVPAGHVSNMPWFFADAFPTIAEIAHASDSVPDDVDGFSVLPTLLGTEQPVLEDRPMYWEAHKFFGFYQVVRKADWKLIRWTRQGPRQHPLGDTDPVLPDDQYPLLELFNLRDDHREERNLAERESARMDELLTLLNSADAHLDDPEWALTEEELKAIGRGGETVRVGDKECSEPRQAGTSSR